ncbi:queuine tRNA-ribosyltransferase family protein [Patescibacteria group bacterium]|nr:queuine tRNA-ribosyltransferase family protein [Patescibacteria group bacterium]
MTLKFDITAKDKKARVGVLHTLHGDVHTPTITVNFTPALIRSGLKPDDIKSLGVELVLVNTFHLFREGVTDVHQYLNWNGPVVADSGGFQMVSLAKEANIHSGGVDFSWDDTVYKMTPENIARWQKDAGVDIIMPLDRVTPTLGNNPLQFLNSVLTTKRWFSSAHHVCPEQTYYIVQGGLNKIARRISLLDANRWLNKDAPGVAIGGLAGGEDREDMYKMVEFCTNNLPTNKPRHLFGIGTPVDLIKCIDLGIDTFDCVASTREARHKRLWTFSGTFELKWWKHKDDNSVIEAGCDCPTCTQGITRAELVKDFQNSLTRQQAQKRCMLHNIHFLMRLMEKSREAIKQSRFAEFKNEFLSRYSSKR